MTKYGNTHRTLSLRILCVLLLGTCLLGGHGTVSAIVDTMTPTNTNKNISVNTNSGSVELTLSGLATEPWQTAQRLPGATLPLSERMQRPQRRETQPWETMQRRRARARMA